MKGRGGFTYLNTVTFTRPSGDDTIYMYAWPNLTLFNETSGTFANVGSGWFDHIKNMDWTINEKQQTGPISQRITALHSGDKVKIKSLEATDGFVVTGYSVSNDFTANQTDEHGCVSLTGQGNMWINIVQNGYAVRFDANGASGEMKNQYMPKDGGDSNRRLPIHTFTNQYTDFLGWSTNPDAVNESQVMYKEGDALPANASGPGGTITLYAVWKWHDIDEAGAKPNTQSSTTFIW